MRQRSIVAGLLLVGSMAFVTANLQAGEHGGKEHGGTAHEGSHKQEHGGKEHGGAPATKEHGGTAGELQSTVTPPSAEQVRQSIASYVNGIESTEGTFTIHDDVTGTERQLTFVRVHERVGKTGDLFYSCTDMRDVATGEILDLDFDVDAQGGRLDVVDTRLHKVSGQARYTYDENDNMIPLSTSAQ